MPVQPGALIWRFFINYSLGLHLVAKLREIEAMNKSSFASKETKVYRLTLLYRVYHFVVGIAALVGAVWCYHFLILAAGLALFSVFMIARPLVMKVTVDQQSVAVKGMFSESSMQRSSITAFERIHTGKGSCLMLRGNDESQSLMIPDSCLDLMKLGRIG